MKYMVDKIIKVDKWTLLLSFSEFDNVQEEEEAADEIGDDPNSASECETDISDSESVTHLSKKRCGRKEGNFHRIF